MRLALAEAETAAAHGDVPIGAVVLGPGGDVIARAGNERELLGDPTAHAEVVALRRAAAHAGDLEHTHFWAGTGWRLARAEPAESVLTRLWADAVAAGAAVPQRS